MVFYSCQTPALTDFRPTEMRASNNIHRGTVTSNCEIEDDDKPPVSNETRNTIDQTTKKCQERELDSHHRHPGEYQTRRYKLAELENSIEVRRLGCEECRRVGKGLGEVHIVHIDVEDCHGGNETAGAERQEEIIKGEFLLHGESYVISSAYTDQAQREQ